MMFVRGVCMGRLNGSIHVNVDRNVLMHGMCGLSTMFTEFMPIKFD